MSRTKQKTENVIDPKKCFNKNLKIAAYELFDEEGQLSGKRFNVFGKFGAMQEQAPEQLELLKEILDFAFKNNYFPDTVRDYLFGKWYITQEDYANSINLNHSTFVAQLIRGRDRFMEVFGTNCLFDLCDGAEQQKQKQVWLPKEKLEQYRSRLNSQKNTVERLQNNLVVDLSPYAGDETSTMSEDEFNCCCQLLWGYTSKIALQKVTELMKQAGFFGYVNHLFKTPMKTPKEQKDFENIIRMIRGEAPYIPCDSGTDINMHVEN